ncbi:MAG: oxidoreductase [Nitrospinae bacterium]|nr:oxidoreductase [Nitrospinota bacterium]|tara:strand:- start:1657 stop:2646 length:990 start_codon:yes stop_codon:yes gene_type:complete
MINVGIIGYGKMGQIRHKVISTIPDAEVICYYDPIIINEKIFKVEKPEQIINNPEVDAIFICTPNFLNKKLTIASLMEGKNVFCEKPPAFTAKDVDEIRKVEKESGKILMYGFNHRHHESIKYMKNIIDDKTFGKILWMRGRYGKSVDKTYYENWRSKREFAGGGILIDQGIHMLDLFIYLGGDFDKIHASVSNLYWNLDVEDNVFATLENSITGLSASLHSTMTQWRHLFSLEVFLEKGYLVLNGIKTSSNTYGDEILTIAKNRSTAPAASWKDEENIVYHSDNSWLSEVNEFLLAINSHKSRWTGSSSDALKLMRIIDKIYSFKEKK